MLHYQPLVPLKVGLPRGFESLARWLHPEHGELSARRLLDIAELAGLGGEVGGELLRLAYEDVRPWFDADDEAFVSFNVSANQVADPDVGTRFLGRLSERGIDPRRLIVEVTEAAFSQGLVVQGNLDALRHAGVRVFLDDFGVGYSSLSHLHHFPVDGIKIDSSVIRPHVDERLVRLIVSVAETLGIKTVAEGVETTEQLNAVTRLGVDYAQGYLLGRPARVPTIRSMDG